MRFMTHLAYSPAIERLRVISFDPSFIFFHLQLGILAQSAATTENLPVFIEETLFELTI